MIKKIKYSKKIIKSKMDRELINKINFLIEQGNDVFVIDETIVEVKAKKSKEYSSKSNSFIRPTIAPVLFNPAFFAGCSNGSCN